MMEVQHPNSSDWLGVHEDLAREEKRRRDAEQRDTERDRLSSPGSIGKDQGHTGGLASKHQGGEDEENPWAVPDRGSPILAWT